MNIKDHPTIIELINFNFKDDYLNWEIHDFVDEYIDLIYERSKREVVDLNVLKLIYEIINLKLKECQDLSKSNPANQKLHSNIAILSLVAVNIKLSSMCIPSSAA